MIGLKVNKEYLQYETKTLLNSYFNQDINIVTDKDTDDTVIDVTVDERVYSCNVYRNRELVSEHSMVVDISDIDEKEYKKKSKQIIKKVILSALYKSFNKRLPWGILTGIRPTKISMDFINKGLSDNDIRQLLKNDYLITEDKIELMLKISHIENAILFNNKQDEINIYIGIPFCPTKCLYCSFTSYSLTKYKDKIDDYVERLIEEISACKAIYKDRPIRTIYIGGGTPTSLNEDQLERLLVAINNSFDLPNIEEFTVEAGRPDTITKAKLQLMKDYNVDRISINPQTMNEDTLKVIGRKHTVKDIIDKYHIARDLDFKNINMDFIVGLPNEDVDCVTRSMELVKKLGPDSITIHTLAVKRASKLRLSKDKYSIVDANTINKMLEITEDAAISMNMVPYYMYRQKNMVGNFENVGYCLPGKESIYNIEIMEEKQTILAFGAGAITKVVYPSENRIERIENVKDVDSYINRIDDMISRKKNFFGM